MTETTETKTETTDETPELTLKDEILAYFDLLENGEEVEVGEVRKATTARKNKEALEALQELVEEGVILCWETPDGPLFTRVPVPKRGTTGPTKEFTAFLIRGLDPKKDRKKAQDLRKSLEGEIGYPVRFHHDRWHKTGPVIRVKLTVPRSEWKAVRDQYSKGHEVRV